jgi:hypothetical protein
MSDSKDTSNELLALRAKLLYELVVSARSAHSELSEEINDEIESSNDFDEHPLATNAANAYSVVLKIEQLLMTELSYDYSGDFRTELEKLVLLDGLKGKNNALRAILKKIDLKS